MPAPKSAGHDSVEAFMLMRYEGAGGRREWLWNSRDGITPFCIASADRGAELHHGNWHLDRYEPFYVPAVGSRVFVDLTEDTARPLAQDYVERHWDRGQCQMQGHPDFAAAGKEGTVEIFVRKWVADWGGHSPHVAVVTEVMHAQFQARREAAIAAGQVR